MRGRAAGEGTPPANRSSVQSSVKSTALRPPCLPAPHTLFFLKQSSGLWRRLADREASRDAPMGEKGRKKKKKRSKKKKIIRCWTKSPKGSAGNTECAGTATEWALAMGSRDQEGMLCIPGGSTGIGVPISRGFSEAGARGAEPKALPPN